MKSGIHEKEVLTDVETSQAHTFKAELNDGSSVAIHRFVDGDQGERFMVKLPNDDVVSWRCSDDDEGITDTLALLAICYSLGSDSLVPIELETEHD